MNTRQLVIRPVWYFARKHSQSYETEAQGIKAHRRPPNAWGIYERAPDGTLNWCQDFMSEYVARYALLDIQAVLVGAAVGANVKGRLSQFLRAAHAGDTAEARRELLALLKFFPKEKRPREYGIADEARMAGIR